jgi:Flp pilus assembly protein TadG
VLAGGGMLTTVAIWWRAWRAEEQGSQIAEFAIALPMLVMVMVAVFDFSGAFNLKQRLAGSAAATARLGAEQAVSDLSGAAPASVTALRDFAAQSLTAAGVNDCGLGTAAANLTGFRKWTFTGSSCAATLVVERQYNYAVVAGGVTVNVQATRVTLSYPYQWRLGRVVLLVAPGASFVGPTTLNETSVVPNLS